MQTKFYNSSPIFIQNFLISLKGKAFIKERYNEHYYREMDILTQNKNSYKLQKEKLNRYMEYVKENSEFHSKRLEKLTFPIDPEDLQNLDTMDKEDIRKNLDSIITTKENLIKLQTGGTTGKSLTFYSNPIDMAERIAFLDYYKSSHGVKKGMKRASFTGRNIVPPQQKKKIFWRFNKSLNQKLFSSFHADGENLKYYVEELNKFKPLSLDGYTNVIYRVANYIVQNNLKLTFKPLAIFPTAETLTPQIKEIIEKAFGCPVRNQYASSEGSPFITECTRGNLHMNIQTGVFELKKVEGNLYEMFITSFFTTTTPLIRYKIGDSVIFTGRECTCGSDCPVVDQIIGRSNEHLVSRERGKVNAIHLSMIIREASRQIIESQFVQNELDEVEIYVVTEANPNKEKIKESLIEPFANRFGRGTRFKLKYVPELPKTNAGKTRFVVNNLN